MDGIGISCNVYMSAHKLEVNGNSQPHSISEQEGWRKRESFTEDSCLAETQDKKKQIKEATVKDVLVIAATNRPDLIDVALLRPGRIDHIIYVPPPDLETRLEILKVHTLSSPLGKDVDLDNIAVDTEMYSGADLENLCREVRLFDSRCSGTSLQEHIMAFDPI